MYVYAMNVHVQLFCRYVYVCTYVYMFVYIYMCNIYHGPEVYMVYINLKYLKKKTLPESNIFFNTSELPGLVYITHIERWTMVYMIYLRQNWPWFYNSSIFVTPPNSCVCVLVTFLYAYSVNWMFGDRCCASISLLYLKILSNWWMIKKIDTKILLRRRDLPYLWVSENSKRIRRGIVCM